MDVLDIVEKYLRDNQLDGLANFATGCACQLADIAPCGEISGECVAGRKIPCRCGEGCGFDIEEAFGK